MDKKRTGIHSSEKLSPCYATLSNNSKSVKSIPLRVVFSTLFSVFENTVNSHVEASPGLK